MPDPRALPDRRTHDRRQYDRRQQLRDALGSPPRFDALDQPDLVDHPPHYRADSVYETIKVIEAWELGFNLGNAVKYISRAGRKHDDVIEDLKKARWYLDHEISGLESA